MKQITSLALVLMVTFSGAFAKEPTGKHISLKGDVVSVSYGQPSKKDGNVIPTIGQAWRTGVNEPTLITLTKGCMFAGRQVNAGTYSLITIPHSGEWEIMLNRNTTQSETFDYDKMKDQTILKGTAVITTSSKKVDAFTIDVNSEGILLSWDKNNIQIPVHPW